MSLRIREKALDSRNIPQENPGIRGKGGAMRKIAMSALALLCLAISVAPAHAATHTVRLCQVQDNWKFSSPLPLPPDSVPAGTTATLDINGLCFYDDDYPVLIDGTGIVNVSGNCVIATYSNAGGTTGAMVGGMVA